MATTNLSIEQVSGARLFEETDLENVKIAVKASSGTMYAIEIDNSAVAAVSYVKLWDVASGSVTVGTTAPNWIFAVPASVKKAFVMPGGIAFGTALTAACVAEAGTAGTTNPSSSVIVRIVYA